MNLTLLSHLEFWPALQNLVCGLAKVLSPAPHQVLVRNAPVARNAPRIIASNSIDTRARVHFSTQQRPLRVVRVLEAGQARTSVGRMVISGRMADVCAELDRLAAREAALS